MCRSSTLHILIGRVASLEYMVLSLTLHQQKYIMHTSRIETSIDVEHLKPIQTEVGLLGHGIDTY